MPLIDLYPETREQDRHARWLLLVGACVVGSERCNDDGSDWDACMEEVLSAMELPTPQGETPVDEDCNR